MKVLQIFENPRFGKVRTYQEEDGTITFCGTDVATALGYGTNPQDAIRRHCRKDGCVNHAVIDSMGRQQEAKFVSEGNLYRLIARSQLPEAEQFESWIFDEVLPSIRKTGQYVPELQKPMTQAEITAMIAQNQVEIERKAIEALETAQKSMELVGRTGKRLDNALDVLSAPPDKDWRQAMNSKVRGMCMEYGLSYPVFFGDLYKELEDTARVDLDARRNRLRKRLEENGATKTESKAVTKLEVVERDVKLRPIFEGIVRKYQAKYVLDRAPEIEPF